MTLRVSRMTAAAEELPLGDPGSEPLSKAEADPQGAVSPTAAELVARGMPLHTFGAANGGMSVPDVWEEEYQRRTYRGRVVALLRRYMRYAMETGRLPSLLGGEFFRARVTSYTVTTFEDRIIFVHDMEMCLQRLDEFSRELLARHILQEHDQLATSKLLHCSERTVRRHVPLALDLLSEILLEMGLMERLNTSWEGACQEDA